MRGTSPALRRSIDSYAHWCTPNRHTPLDASLRIPGTLRDRLSKHPIPRGDMPSEGPSFGCFCLLLPAQGSKGCRLRRRENVESLADLPGAGLGPGPAVSGRDARLPVPAALHTARHI